MKKRPYRPYQKIGEYFSKTIICSFVLAMSARGVEFPMSPIDSEMKASIRQMADLRFDLASSGEDFGSTDRQETRNNGKTKSVFKAGLYSALLPGAGEYYLGAKKKARVFFVVEALSWVGFATFRTYSGWKKDDYIRFAAANANARLEGKSDEFHDLVGFFDDIDAANTEGRISNPGQPFLPDTPENHWRWTDPDDRARYRTLKNRSREAGRRADFMIGAAIVNRIVSVVDAVISAKKAGQRIGRKFTTIKRRSFALRFDPLSRDRQLSFTYYPGL